MKNLTIETLTDSIFDNGRMDLLFNVDGKIYMASGKAPEGSYTDEDYWEDEKNLADFLEDAEIEER